MAKFIVFILLQALLWTNLPPYAVAQETGLTGEANGQQLSESAATSDSLLQQVASLETTVYGMPSALPLTTRLARLETDTLGKTQTGTLHDRVNVLQNVLERPVDRSQPLQLSQSIQRQIPAPFQPGADNLVPAASPLRATVQQNELNGALPQQQMGLPPAPPPSTQSSVRIPKEHPKLKAFAHNFGVALKITLVTAAVVAGAAAAAYGNGRFTAAPVDTCACPP